MCQIVLEFLTSFFAVEMLNVFPVIKIKDGNLTTTVNSSLKFSVMFRQQLLSSSNCCLLSSASGRHREQQIVVDAAQLVGPSSL